MAEPRLLFFHDPNEASQWQRALDSAGLDAQCLVWDETFRDERGFWQPPRYLWKEIGGLQVYLIDGFWFRNNVNIGFALGGHHWVFESIPEDAIYLEPAYLEHLVDQDIILGNHEMPEREDMRSDPRCVYEEAHGVATRGERRTRDGYREVQEDEQEPAARLDPLDVAHATLRLGRHR